MGVVNKGQFWKSVKSAPFSVKLSLQITQTAQSRLLPSIWSQEESDDSESHFQWQLPPPQILKLQIAFSSEEEIEDGSPAVKVNLLLEQTTSSTHPDESGFHLS